MCLLLSGNILGELTQKYTHQFKGGVAMAYKQVTVSLPEEVLNVLEDDAAVTRKAHEALDTLLG